MWRDEKEQPIFVGGDGRSGTTLLSVVLNSHPDVWMGQELHFRGPENVGPHVLECLDLLERQDPRVVGKEVYRSPYRAGVQFVRRVVRCGFAWTDLRECIRAARADTGTDLADHHDRCALMAQLGRLGASRARKSRWGFKIMREIQAPSVYSECWPEASFVHIIRDGRDVAASQVLDHSWGYESIAGAATGWSSLIARSRRHDHARYVEIRFEDLVTRSEVFGLALLDSLGLPRSDRILAHAEQSHDFFETKVVHPSRDAVMRPLNDQVVRRYLEDLTPDEVAEFEAIAGDTLEGLGYPVAERG